MEQLNYTTIFNAFEITSQNSIVMYGVSLDSRDKNQARIVPIMGGVSFCCLDPLPDISIYTSPVTKIKNINNKILTQ